MIADDGGVTSARHGGSHGNASSPSAVQQSCHDDDELTFSDVGAIDLSMKKPRCSSASPAKPPPSPPPPSLPAVSKPASDGAASSLSEQAMTEALCSLLTSQQYGAAEQAALAQLIAGQQLAASAGTELPLSLAAAAAASAGLFPPIFDGMSGLH